ncbi:hypothetical protein PMW_55 [Pseudomonas phage phiPMW]|uniref:Uncharacterized protein n=1 Tax=Pseudomonas phage phiPMW TaxID=1815582 RepID=A0A1S5R195_9CAUD|nr:hypothetical protein FDG97_gp055 [Pseudomonas phage phiPMW]ANA49180.1 hypothetical protein PMW_55 [Pseudomonas phage phiPMW]
MNPAIATILMTAIEEFKNVKRNKSGSVNETSRFAIHKRATRAIVALGETYDDAFDMVAELSKKYAV